jgi:transposase
MPAPYSYDLRTKAIKAVKRGERKIEVCRMLSISRNTLALWLKREEETGDCKAIVNFQQGSGQKITDCPRFQEFVEQHGDLTQGQMAQLWGENVTQQNISKALCKLGISRKKKHTAIKREPK